MIWRIVNQSKARDIVRAVRLEEIKRLEARLDVEMAGAQGVVRGWSSVGTGKA